MLEVTEALDELLHGQKLRGTVWSVFVDKTSKARPAVQGSPIECPPATELRPAFDVRPVVQRVYHANAIAFDVANPVPRRLVLEASYGSVPEALFSDGAEEAQKATPEQMAALRAKMREQLKGLRGTRPAQTSNVNGTGKGANHE